MQYSIMSEGRPITKVKVLLNAMTFDYTTRLEMKLRPTNVNA